MVLTAKYELTPIRIFFLAPNSSFALSLVMTSKEGQKREIRMPINGRIRDARLWLRYTRCSELGTDRYAAAIKNT